MNTSKSRMAGSGGSASVKIIKDLRSLQEEPIEGVFCELLHEANVFEWRIYFEGPEGSPYQGGIFEANMTFPKDYPMNPPKLALVSEFWHPNVFKDGRVCISILHSPGNDPLSGELAEERWMPTQTVATIMLSFQSMLSDPNISSPANVDASTMWRDRRQEFIEKCAKLVQSANLTVPKNVIIPHPDTDPIQRSKRLEKMKKLNDLNTFSLTNMDDSDDLASDELGDSDDENLDGSGTEIIVDVVDCPVCKASMITSKGHTLACATCPIQYKDGKYRCGRKCYVLDCGEVRPSGVCEIQIKSEEGWKCSKNTHKDDKNGEENFLETMM